MSELIVVSLKTLISFPDEYHEKSISVHGFLSLKFEGHSLWSSEPDYDKRNPKNSVWIDISISEANLIFDGECVELEGVFNSKRKGHFGLYSGTIENITRIEKSSLDES
ncbi:MAG: hypothetical protein DRR42_24000 [Gammaproteobacteria bacterium]|nr:MAG: hypothetical protein DRR42_24000 [Gammaproteobacteria bacterium]